MHKTVNRFAPTIFVLRASSLYNKFHHLLGATILLQNSGSIVVSNLIRRSYFTCSRFLNPNSGAYKNYKSLISLQSTSIKMSSFSSSTTSSGEELFDISAFEQVTILKALKIPKNDCASCLKELNKYLLHIPKTKRVYEIEGNPDYRHVLLSVQHSTESPLNPAIETYLSNIKGIACIEDYSFKTSYECLTVDEVLRKLLPEHFEEIPSSFEQVGHIAHLNLRDYQLKYKSLIGKVILDKNYPTIKTVVNKVGIIETEYRTFPMEVIAGEPLFEVSLRESGAIFSFSFKDVYWNSRLQTEHRRLIDNISQKHMVSQMQKRGGGSSANRVVVADMMAGVGPFAIPLAMGGVEVFANDLNPESYKYLVKNATTNKCTGKCNCYNMDGRKFILDIAGKGTLFTDVVMNLPQNATDFLDVFIGIGHKYPPGLILSSEQLNITIHVYGFSTADDPVLDMAARCASTMQCEVSDLGFVASVNYTQLARGNEAGSDSSDGGGVVGGGTSISNGEKKRKYTQLNAEANNNSNSSNSNNNSSILSSSSSSGGGAVEVAFSTIPRGHIVRDVSPKKVMVCLEFKLPACVIMSTKGI